MRRLLLAVPFSGGTLTSSQATEGPARPNVVLIIADDLA
jgi:hypothetical protein